HEPLSQHSQYQMYPLDAEGAVKEYQRQGGVIKINEYLHSRLVYDHFRSSVLGQPLQLPKASDKTVAGIMKSWQETCVPKGTSST
ncbi:hypothetical protein KIPB_017207, partial [Kipferlia bialata]